MKVYPLLRKYDTVFSRAAIQQFPRKRKIVPNQNSSLGKSRKIAERLLYGRHVFRHFGGNETRGIGRIRKGRFTDGKRMKCFRRMQILQPFGANFKDLLFSLFAALPFCRAGMQNDDLVLSQTPV